MSSLFSTTILFAFLWQNVQSWSSNMNVFPPKQKHQTKMTTLLHLSRHQSTTSSRNKKMERLYRLNYNTNSDNNNNHNIFGGGGNNSPQEGVGKDWRDFRAKLVLQELGQDTTSFSSADGQIQKWAYDSGLIIETGSLIVSHPVQEFVCGGLKQQYFHKCVVLVVQHDPNVFTKGIILNRPTKETMRDYQNVDWRVWFGGDVQGLETEEEEFTCLHRLDSPLAKELSMTIVDDIQQTPWDIAQFLVEQGEATPDDFWLGCGYAGWKPGYLQRELEQGNWFMVASDSKSIFEYLEDAPDDTSGTLVWTELMKKIGKEEILHQVQQDQQFEDTMLKEWIEERVLPSTTSTTTTTTSSSQPNQAQEEVVRNPEPGRLLRASSTVLLDDQVFHQSIVLVLETDDRGTAGLILNRPSSGSVVVDDERLPVRYGGSYGMNDGVKPEFWLYYDNQKLRDASVGVPIGVGGNNNKDSLFWQCTREDAETAISMGLAEPNDFLVISGMSLWDRSKALGKPLAKVELERYFSYVDDSTIPNVWDALTNQIPLSEDNIAESLQLANEAWKSTETKSYDPTSSGVVWDDQQSLQLANDALDRWMRVFLLNHEID